MAVLPVAVRAAAVGSEVRGAWVSAWNGGYLTPEQADSTIAAAKAAGLNTLFIQARKVADAYYNSSIEPRAPNLAPDFDPLAYMIEKAHGQGLRVHAWVNVCRVWIGQGMPTDPNHLVNLHPDWLNKDSSGTVKAADGIFIDPGVPAAREHVAKVVQEIAQKYDIDGVHLDYIRYPGKDWGYSAEALARYQAETGAQSRPSPGDPKWLRWRRDRVTDLLKGIRKAVRGVKPGLRISAATVSWANCSWDFCSTAPYKLTCQDWKEWLSKGLLDANVPMNYQCESTARGMSRFRSWLSGFRRWSAGKPTYVGIDVHHNTPDGILRQIKAVKRYRLGGFVLFSFNDLPGRDAIVSALSGKPWVTVSKPPLTSQEANVAESRVAFEKGIRSAEANQLGMAKVYLNQAITLDPNYAEAYFRLGRCYFRENNVYKARELYTKTIEIDPNHVGAKTELDALKP